MRKKMTKLEKEVKKHEKLVEEIIADKTKALVRAKKGEHWIKNQQEEYQEVVKEYNDFCRSLRKKFIMKHSPFYMRALVHVIMFTASPIRYVKGRLKDDKTLVEIYWGYKKIKKEWEDDFDYTEQQIDEDFEFVEKCEAFIEKQKELLKRGYKVISKQKEKGTNNG